MGDWNTVISETKIRNIACNFRLKKWNDRGDYLIQFYAKYNLTVTNIYFNHCPKKRYTWKIPGDINRYQIDYIIIKNRFKNQTKDSRNYPGADVNSDHNLVMM